MTFTEALEKDIWLREKYNRADKSTSYLYQTIWECGKLAGMNEIMDIHYPSVTTEEQPDLYTRDELGRRPIDIHEAEAWIDDRHNREETN